MQIQTPSCSAALLSVLVSLSTWLVVLCCLDPGADPDPIMQCCPPLSAGVPARMAGGHMQICCVYVGRAGTRSIGLKLDLDLGKTTGHLLEEQVGSGELLSRWPSGGASDFNAPIMMLNTEPAHAT